MTLPVTRPPYTRYYFTIDEYHRMVEAGILTEDDRVELLEGEIVAMTPIGRLHAAEVGRLTHRFARTVLDSALIWVQNPLHLDEGSEPQPDLMLLVPKPDFYRSGHPVPDEVLLLVEVADSSGDIDRRWKIPLYARAGIREAWLVDLSEDALIVYRDPTADGYQTIGTPRRGEWVSLLAFPGREIAVADILG